MEAAAKTTATVGPVRGKQRIDDIDILRGFALFGVLTFNIIGFSGQSLRYDAWSNGLDQGVYFLTQLLVQAKFYSLFSFLFGWGMAMQMIRAEERGANFLPRYLRRILILLAFGLFHSIFIWDGDILTDYALFGLVLILFRKRSDRFLLIGMFLSLSLSVVMVAPWPWMEAFRASYAALTDPIRDLVAAPYDYLAESYLQVTMIRLRQALGMPGVILYYFGNIFAMFLLGFYFGRKRIFQDIPGHIRNFRWLCIGGLVVGLPLNYVFARTWVEPDWLTGPYARMISIGARTFGAPALAMFYVSALVLLLQTKAGRQRLEPLANVGRMALTNYITHSLVFTLMFYGYGLGWYGRFGPFTGQLITIGTFLLQIRFSKWWLERYQFGPLEWAWRAMTYGRRQPFRVGVTYADLEARAAERDADKLRQLRRDRRFLLGAWALLAAWAVGLYIWRGAVDQRAETYEALMDALNRETEASVQASEGTVAGEFEEDQEQRTPQVVPVVYEPGELVASGDMMALASVFDGELALDQLAALTDDSYGGRAAGSSEGAQAAAYLADQFEQLGLQPGNLDGGYLQAFPVHHLELTAMPRLAITGEDGSPLSMYRFQEDFTVEIGRYAGPGVGEGDVVWGNNCTREDFDDFRVEGDIVFCRVVEDVDAARNALEHGAAGLILLATENDLPIEMAVPYREIWLATPLPTLRVSAAVAADLLSGSGYSLGDLSLLFNPVRLETHVRMEIVAEQDEGCGAEGCYGQNVIGVLPGRDEQFRDDVILVSADFDALGESPAGGVYAGANAPASGMAVLLELARVWQQEGFVPLRTVVFAAWDGSRQDEAGLRYFLEHSSYPLEQIVQAFHVGAVGAEGFLGTSSEEGRDQLLLTAEAMGVNLLEMEEGLASVQLFSEAGVDALGFEVRDENGFVPRLGRPDDAVEFITSDQLLQTGRFVDGVLLMWSESMPAIQAMLEERAQALVESDPARFLSSTVPENMVLDEAWFQDSQTYDPVIASMTSEDLLVEGTQASGLVEMRIEYLDGDGDLESQTLRADIRFEQRDGAWLWAGADLPAAYQWGDDTPEGQRGLTLFYPARMLEDPEAFIAAVVESYRSYAGLLGLSPSPDLTVMLFPNTGELRASAGYSCSRDETLTIDNGLVRMKYVDDLAQTADWQELMAAMLLAEAGVDSDAAGWLLPGLTQVLRVESDPMTWQPSLLNSLTAIQDVDEEVPSRSFTWARVEYIRQRYGWRGLGRLIVRLGRTCSGGCDPEYALDQALEAFTGDDLPAFNSAWLGYWGDALSEHQQRIDTLLAQRQQAVLGGDLQAFLTTVDRQIPALIAEQTAWFEAMQTGQVDAYRLSGDILAILEDGSLLARVTVEYNLGAVETRWGQGAVPITVYLRRVGNELVWSGSLLETMSAGRVSVLYSRGQEAAAEAILEEAADQAVSISAYLGMGYSQPIVIKLYDNSSLMRMSIDAGLPGFAYDVTWAMPDSIKMLLEDGALPENFAMLLSRSIVRCLLYEAGIQSEWITRAFAAELSTLVDDRETELLAMANLSRVVRLARDGGLLDLRDLPVDFGLDDDDYGLYSAQAWSSMDYFMEQAGVGSLQRLSSGLRREGSLEEFVTQWTGLTFDEFQLAWQQSLVTGGANPEWVETALSFDADLAMQHVVALARESMDGRRTGSEGGAEAAGYIAAQFASLGLEPAGSPSPVLLDDSSGEGSTEETLAAYYQFFPFDVVEMTSAPVLELHPGDEEAEDRFLYREEFRLLPILLNGEFDVTSEIVWVQSPRYEGLDFGGRIVLRDPVLSITEEIAMAEEHGAGALILVGEADTPRETLARTDFPAEDLIPANIPVYEIFPEPFERILSAAGLNRISAYETPPALRLGVEAHVMVQQSLTENVPVANVLGLLPGSDPARRHEVVILSAHFDFVGDDPDAVYCEPVEDGEPICETGPGLRYPGANDNASGVAVLLEIARIWQESGYQPGRSILFVAWNGQEQGELGSNYYVQNPVFPLSDTVAMLQLDTVGAGEGYYLETTGMLSQDGYLLYTMQAVENLVDGRLHLNYQVANGTAIRSRPESFYDTYDETGLTAESDHLPFRAEGIPALLIRWRGADETNLPEGLAFEVDPNWLDYAGRMVSMAVELIAR